MVSANSPCDSLVQQSLRSVVLQIGVRCPLSCSHCYVSAGPGRGPILSLGSIAKILEGYAALDAPQPKQLGITGGDPFAMRRQLEFAAELAVSNNIKYY